MVSGATFGRYEVRGTLGIGGFATVLRARDPALDRDVAIKVLFPHLASDGEVRRRFLAEAKRLVQLRHPNIVAVQDIGEADGTPYFVMDLIEGRTFAEVIAADGRLDPDRVIGLVSGLCSAIDYLHAAGLVHRDIKASNVMVDASDRTFLMDFGIVVALDQTRHTRTGAGLGTPESMSPEQVRGHDVGPAADIYSLGILTYQMLAGRPPFGSVPVGV